MGTLLSKVEEIEGRLRGVLDDGRTVVDLTEPEPVVLISSGDMNSLDTKYIIESLIKDWKII